MDAENLVRLKWCAQTAWRGWTSRKRIVALVAASESKPPRARQGERRVFQIGCHMSEAEIADLESYAARLELTRTAVFSLAIQQELRMPQLEHRETAMRANAPGCKGSGGRRVTVHMRSKALKDAFTMHAKTRGYGSDEAAWTVLRNELRAETLYKALGVPWNHT